MAGNTERRSSRQRRAVDYRKLQDQDSDDDDFADLPPLKKAKTSKTPKEEPARPKEEEHQTKRLSRDEKMYNRAIEQALKESQNNPPESKKTTDNVGSDNEFVPSQLSEEEDDSCNPSDDSDFQCSPVVTKKKAVSKKATKQTVARKTEKAATKPTQKTANKPAVSKHTIKANKNTIETLSTVNETLAKPVTGIDTSNTPSANTHKCPPVQPATPANRTPVLGGRRTPKWTPPAQVSKGAVCATAMKTNTGSPTIRIGLSRNARIKPLHGNRTPK